MEYPVEIHHQLEFLRKKLLQTQSLRKHLFEDSLEEGLLEELFTFNAYYRTDPHNANKLHDILSKMSFILDVMGTRPYHYHDDELAENC